MTANEYSTKIKWYDREHAVRIEWKVEKGEVVYILCQVDGKEVVRLVKGLWLDKKGRRHDPAHFYKLKRACLDNFRQRRHEAAELMPIFSILHGEEM